MRDRLLDTISRAGYRFAALKKANTGDRGIIMGNFRKKDSGKQDRYSITEEIIRFLMIRWHDLKLYHGIIDRYRRENVASQRKEAKAMLQSAREQRKAAEEMIRNAELRKQVAETKLEVANLEELTARLMMEKAELQHGIDNSWRKMCGRPVVEAPPEVSRTA